MFALIRLGVLEWKDVCLYLCAAWNYGGISTNRIEDASLRNPLRHLLRCDHEAAKERQPNGKWKEPRPYGSKKRKTPKSTLPSSPSNMEILECLDTVSSSNETSPLHPYIIVRSPRMKPLYTVMDWYKYMLCLLKVTWEVLYCCQRRQHGGRGAEGWRPSGDCITWSRNRFCVTSITRNNCLSYAI